MAPGQLGDHVGWFATVSRVARRVSPLVLAAVAAGLLFLLWSSPMAGLAALAALGLLLFVLDVA